MLSHKALSLISAYLNGPVPAFESPRSEKTATKPVLKKNESRVRAIIFSKDRPGQLFACLSSASLCISGIEEWIVIYLATNNSSLKRYREACSRCRTLAIYNTIRFIKQENESTFARDLLLALNSGEVDATTDFVWFQVDDAVHYRGWNARDVAEVLNSKPDVLCVHTKLWKGATRCHPAGDTTMVKPPSSIITSGNQQQFCLFDRNKGDGSFDWNYAFDLSGGLYRLEDVQELLSAIPPQEVTNPNMFESLGNQYIVSLAILKPLSACFDLSQPVFSLVTLNRTQQSYLNPVYESKYKSTPPWEQLTDDLFNHPLDLERYQQASSTYDSVHIGDLFLNKLSTTNSLVDASVLIPCRNAEATLSRAIQSILNQDCGPYRVEIVVVDDASEDASAFIASSFHPRVRLFSRLKSNKSVAQCLDYGLQFCRGRFIVRMDADDEALPGRIRAQLDEMCKRPSLGVLGTQCLITNRQNGIQSNQLRRANTPIGPASVAWSLFFYCPLVHPSVCIRKTVLEEMGGYSASNHSEQVMEDLALWFRLVTDDKRKWELDNLEITGLVLNKSSDSVTSKWNKQESDEMYARVAVEHLKQRCRRPGVDNVDELTVHLWMIVCHPDRYFSAGEQINLPLILAVLDELSNSIISEYQHSSYNDEDMEFVRRDTEARKLELVHLFQSQV